MDLEKVLSQLHEELQNLDAAIDSLERLQEGAQRRSGHAEWLATVEPESGKPERQTTRKPPKGKKQS